MSKRIYGKLLKAIEDFVFLLYQLAHKEVKTKKKKWLYTLIYDKANSRLNYIRHFNTLQELFAFIKEKYKVNDPESFWINNEYSNKTLTLLLPHPDNYNNPVYWFIDLENYDKENLINLLTEIEDYMVKSEHRWKIHREKKILARKRRESK